MGSKKHKGSTATKAVVHQAHEEHTDVDVDGNITGGACIVDVAPIKSTNATGNSMIKVNFADTTNVAATGDAVVATALGCAFRFLFRFFGDQNLEQDSSSGPDSGGIWLEHTLMFRIFKRPEP